MLPVITIVGRPNVGKSTLFNYLTKTRDALVANFPGLTRDRQYGQGKVGDKPYIVIDTGGLYEPDDPEMAAHTDRQVEQAIAEADHLLFLVDAKDGISSADEEIAKRLRSHSGKISLLVNKADRADAATVCGDFYKLGLGEPLAVSATQGRGLIALMDELLTPFPAEGERVSTENGVRIAVIGRPNVGKSTLINRILGEERVVVFDRPGTTRDSVEVPFERRDQRYILIDTAGVRRRARVKETIEKFSVIKTLQAIKQSHVVVLVLNAQEGLSEQDLRLLGLVLEAGKALVIVVNKWDGMDEYDRTQMKKAMERQLSFVTFARRYFISALHGSGVGKIYHAIDEAFASASRIIATADVTRILEKAIATHQPPMVKGRRIKLRYAHVGGHHPLIIVIHGKQTASLPGSYQRYLANHFREALKLVGVPVHIHFKSDDNPFR